MPPFPHPAADRGGPIEWAETRRILLVRPDNLGDVVMLTPALRALRAHVPDARLDLLASPVGSSLAPVIPYLDGTLAISPVWQDADGRMPHDPDRELALVSRVKAGRYDVVVVFTSFSQSPWPMAYVAYLAGIPVRAGHSKEFGGSLLTHWVTPPPDETHQVDRCLHLLEALGVPPAGTHLELRVPDDARDRAAAALARAGIAPARPYALLAPGASCSARRYPADRFGKVAAELAERGLPVAVVGSAGERDLVAEVVSAAGSLGVAAVGPLDTPAFVALVAGAAVAVTNDSGGMHVADAVGTPVVVAFSGTELEDQLAPRTVRAELFRVPTSCSPCHQFRCPFGLPCLDLDPTELAGTAYELAPRCRPPDPEGGEACSTSGP
ncbi:ADP-heptose--lipooligosaccharide heptosyltransferase II [Carbonactinospora thermoautotrophica]|uniref:ADP-heptose--lipooligosaccharide heptosyltransferase II n=1 Tax=Carbonactinospora thermoautotrophica TaxID=1469144 RepID=A0A132N0I8_9ACTN|nr:ADP-heptose--lipooligosaccharide heptosyltransferase II [Carbonactinospora thermoautotrophica]